MPTNDTLRRPRAERLLVRVDPEIWVDEVWVTRCSLPARGAYFDSLFFLAALGERDGLYPHAALVGASATAAEADGIAAQLVDFGVWDFAGLGYRVHPYNGCRLVRESRAAIPEAVKAAVFKRDGNRCVECGSVDDLTLDHVWPWSLGGEDTVENLRVLCRPCNSRKGART